METHTATDLEEPRKNVKKNTPPAVFFNFFFHFGRKTPLKLLYKKQEGTDTYNTILKQQSPINKNAYVCIRKEKKKRTKRNI